MIGFIIAVVGPFHQTPDHVDNQTAGSKSWFEVWGHSELTWNASIEPDAYGAQPYVILEKVPRWVVMERQLYKRSHSHDIYRQAIHKSNR